MGFNRMMLVSPVGLTVSGSTSSVQAGTEDKSTPCKEIAGGKESLSSGIGTFL